MTAAPQESDLNLNLVFESAPKPSAPSAIVPSKKKRKNKYDRRREKGRLAKLSKQEKLLSGAKCLSHDASGGSKRHDVVVGTNDVSDAAAWDDEENKHFSRSAQICDQDISDASSEEKAVKIAESKTSDENLNTKRNDAPAMSSITPASEASSVSAVTPSNQLVSSRKNRVRSLSLSNIFAYLIYMTSDLPHMALSRFNQIYLKKRSEHATSPNFTLVHATWIGMKRPLGTSKPVWRVIIFLIRTILIWRDIERRKMTMMNAVRH